ncbi:hypothetical protein [Microbacterium elymi]|uniref:Uncharacterized protein n=1 Tax=Microbacterium elymi TaxID=2909587 RepID=A0ABY5NIE6_9MICO|nr:hypothetical protein [Microbacterium elymi]UUT34896.1 hypothetical protein L2X98_31315 [Microbacterium elymi]
MRGARVVLVCLLALVLAGCAGGPGAFASPRPVATPVSALGCGGEDAGPAPGGIPAGFTPNAAYLCDPIATQDDAQGTWSGTRLTRYAGDLAPLVAALAESDEPRWPGPCPAIGFAGPLLWLGAADGSYLRVAYPATGCGMPRTDAVFAALDALTVVDEHFQRDRLIDSAAARRDGCPPTAAPLILLGHAVEPVPQLLEPRALTLCRYEGEPPASDGPDASVSSPAFAGAAVLDEAAAVALLDEATVTTPASACDVPASRYVVLVAAPGPTPAPSLIQDVGDALTVELDGCRRLIDRAHRAFAAPEPLLACCRPRRPRRP